MAAQPDAAQHVDFEKPQPIRVADFFERNRLEDSQVVYQNVEIRENGESPSSPAAAVEPIERSQHIVPLLAETRRANRARPLRPGSPTGQTACPQMVVLKIRDLLWLTE
jgi:hypothetical protein